MDRDNLQASLAGDTLEYRLGGRLDVLPDNYESILARTAGSLPAQWLYGSTKQTGHELFFSAIKEVPGALLDSVTNIPASISGAFESTYAATLNSWYSMTGQEGKTYAQYEGHSAGVKAGLRQLTDERIAGLSAMVSPIGIGMEFPVGTFNDQISGEDPSVSQKPGYQEGVDAAAVYNVLADVAVGGVGFRRLRGLRPSLKEQPLRVFSNQFPDHSTSIPTIISDTKLRVGAGKYNYVVLESGQLIIGRRFSEPGGGHIDLAAGKSVLAAGEVRIVSGNIKYIDNTSGHYEPSGRFAQAAAEKAFANKGFDVLNKYVEKVWVPDPRSANPNVGGWVPK